MASDSILTPAFNEEKWVERISQNLVKETPIAIPVSIFNVPKTVNNPEAYIPKTIALGPYHHFEPELYQMERYKLATVRSFLKSDQIVNFDNLVIDELKAFSPVIRACYHKYIDFDDTTLAWIMAVDGVFLLRLLTSSYANPEANNHHSESRRISKEAVICRDVIVLENQIPYFVLYELRKLLQLSSMVSIVYDDDSELFDMFRGFCDDHSPLPLGNNSIFTTTSTSHLHLLDLMYHLIVNPTPSKSNDSDSDSAAGSGSGSGTNSEDVDLEGGLTQNLVELAELGLSSGMIGQKFLKPAEVIEKLPWERVYNLLGLKSAKKGDDNVNPLLQEIKIPSVKYLSKIGGIKFNPTSGGIREIRFVEKDVTFYLPVLTLNSNSEVILRNLVAYEAATSESTHELAQYVGLMSGIIDSAEDADMLKKNGIIKGNLSSEEIFNLFNEINDISAKEGNKTINEVNAYFSKKPKVKAYNRIKERVYASWKILTLFTTVAIILLLTLQSFCDVYGCNEFFGRSR